MKLVSLDVETECAKPGCTENDCDHALDEFRNRITIAGTYTEIEGVPQARVFRDVPSLASYLDSLGPHGLLGHNFKFDLRVLAAHGLPIPLERWVHDSRLMAAVLTEKVSEDYMRWYGAEREKRNEKLPKGKQHRAEKHHSLKVLAPYFLGVQPFWEDPTNHDNAEYVITDCYYTYKLAEHLSKLLKQEGSYDFYRHWLLPRAKMLLQVEQKGVSLDKMALAEAEVIAAREMSQEKAKLDVHWAPAYEAYHAKKLAELVQKYTAMRDAAIVKVKMPEQPTEKAMAKLTANHARIHARYKELLEKAKAKIEPLSIDSPKQLMWLFRDHMGLDITDFEGDESTGKVVLKRLAGEGRQDIATFLEYRKQQKLVTAFFPSYREMEHNGVLHCTFNPAGTRTGRLSSSRPNLQQVPGHLHKLFVARPGYKLITKDESAIEPRVIAALTGDVNLYDIISKGQDFHGFATRELFEEPSWDIALIKATRKRERDMGKRLDLQLFYGSGAGGIQRTAQEFGYKWSMADCKRKLDRYKEYFAGVYAYRDQLNERLYQGEIVRNLFDRPYSILDPSDVHMKGFNTLVQSTASDIVLDAAYQIMAEFQRRGIDGHVLLLVHDELVIEVREDQVEEADEIITKCMTNYVLPCALGPIKLDVEGKTATAWTK